MNWLWYLLSIVILFLVIIFFSKLRIVILWKRNGQDDQGEVRLSIWGGLIHYKIEIPNVQYKGWEQGVQVKQQKQSQMSTFNTQDQKLDLITKKDIRKMKENYQYLLVNISYFHQILRSFFCHITNEELVWKTRVGTGDAAESGILTGIIWGVKTTSIAFISGYINWEQPPKLEVIPDFHQAVMETFFRSIFHFRIGYAIILILRIFYRIRKGRSKSSCLNENIPFEV